MCRSEHLMITSDMDYDRGRTQKNPTTFLALMVEERLFFILNFLKNNPLRKYHGSVFGVSQQQRGQWIHTLAIMLKISYLRPECSRMRTWLDSKSSLKKEVGRRSSMITRRRGIPRPSNPEVRCSSTNKEALRKNAYHGAENQKRTHFIHSNQSRTCHFWHQDFPCDQRH